MRCGALLSPRRLLSTNFNFFSGRFVLNGIGDGGDDSPEIVNNMDCLTVVLALLIGVVFQPYEHAANNAGNIDARRPGLGLIYFAITASSFTLLMSALLMALCTSIVITSIPTAAEARYFIHISRHQLTLPILLGVCLTPTLAMMSAMDAIIYSRGWDEEVDEVGDDLGLYVAVPTNTTFDDGHPPAPQAWRKYRGKDDFDIGEPAPYLALVSICNLVPAVALTLWFCLVIIMKQRHARALFSADESPACYAEIENMSKPDARAQWFARPTAAEVRAHLVDYVLAFSNLRSVGCMESPEHFREFVLRRERAKGHGDLTHITRFAA